MVLCRFKEKEENLPPAENPSTYPSIRKEVGEHLDAGKVPKRATFEVTKMLVRFQKYLMLMSSTDRKITKPMTP